MSKFAQKGTTQQCLDFSASTTDETASWWYRGGKEAECKSILTNSKPFANDKDVHFSSFTDGAEHKEDHTHVIRARVNFAQGEYGIETRPYNGLIRENELWLKTQQKQLVMLDTEFGCQPITVNQTDEATPPSEPE